MTQPLLEVRNLKKYFATKNGLLHAVDDVSFTISERETLGLVGESGCGKSTTGRVILRLLRPTSGEVLMDGQDVSGFNRTQLKAFRKQAQIVFQDPFASLNPRMRIFDIVSEPFEIHGIYRDSKERIRKVQELMDTVGLSQRLVDSYPHELDGGRRQRVGIAKAIALNPKLMVLDEPVSALDVSVQAQILNLLTSLQRDLGLTYLFISHDLAVVKHVSDRIAVMYTGRIVEFTDYKTLFRDPLHPYSQALISAIPVPNLKPRTRIILEGDVPSPLNPKPCCRFYGRCFKRTDICGEIEPSLDEVKPGVFVACHHVDKQDNGLPASPLTK